MAVNNKKMPTLSATYRGICFKAPIFDYGGPVKTHCSENGWGCARLCRNLRSLWDCVRLADELDTNNSTCLELCEINYLLLLPSHVATIPEIVQGQLSLVSIVACCIQHLVMTLPSQYSCPLVCHHQNKINRTLGTTQLCHIWCW